MSEHEVMEIVSEDQFEEALKSNLPVFVDFWAPWCGPCKAMMPIVFAIAKQYPENIKVVKVNIDNLLAIASKYEIRGIPHCILFQKGVQLASVTGLQSQRVLEDFLKQHLPALKD